MLGWVSDTEGGEATRKVMTGGGQPVVRPRAGPGHSSEAVGSSRKRPGLNGRVLNRTYVIGPRFHQDDSAAGRT